MNHFFSAKKARNELIRGSVRGSEMQQYIILGVGVLIILGIYAFIWRKSPKVATVFLLIVMGGLLYKYGDWANWREFVFVEPSGNLGELAP